MCVAWVYYKYQTYFVSKNSEPSKTVLRAQKISYFLFIFLSLISKTVPIQIVSTYHHSLFIHFTYKISTSKKYWKPKSQAHSVFIMPVQKKIQSDECNKFVKTSASLWKQKLYKWQRHSQANSHLKNIFWQNNTNLFYGFFVSFAFSVFQNKPKGIPMRRVVPFIIHLFVVPLWWCSLKVHSCTMSLSMLSVA